MTQPAPYIRTYSFTNSFAAQPSQTFPGNALDAELNNAKATLDQILQNLTFLQNDDGSVRNGSIGAAQISSAITMGFTPPTPWATGTAYSASPASTVFANSAFYSCLVSHASSATFAADLAAGKWVLIADLTTIPLKNASQIAVTPTGGIVTSDTQSALVGLDTRITAGAAASAVNSNAIAVNTTNIAANTASIATNTTNIATNTTNIATNTAAIAGAKIVGTTTNDNAIAGNIGQYIESVVATPGFLIASATPTDVTSISLPAGDWDVSGFVEFDGIASTSFTQVQGSISLTSATLDAWVYTNSFNAIAITGAGFCFEVPKRRLSLAVTTTVYLVGRTIATVSNPKVFGTISARRIR